MSIVDSTSDSDGDRALAVAVDIRIVIGQIRRRLREEANLGDFTPSQASVVLRLEQGPATASALAKLEGVRPQSMGETVAVLKAAGLISGAPDPADGRQTVLSLTPACRKAIKAARAAREDWLARAILGKLAPREREKLAAGVALLKRLVE